MKLDELLADKNSRLREYRVILDSMKRESEAKLEKLREIAADKFDSDDRIVIGVNGSIARREFTSGSDIDLFL